MLTGILIAIFVALWGAWAVFHYRDATEGNEHDRFADVLTEMSVRGKTDEAALDMMNRYPKRPEPVHLWIEVAAARGDKPEAIRRAEVLVKKFPRDQLSYSLGATTLRAANRIEDAGNLLEKGIKRLGKKPALMSGLAHLALNAGDTNLAIERFAEQRRVLPLDLDGYIWGAETLIRAGRHDEAETVLREAIDERSICFNDVALSRYAELARRREDWTEAARRWALVRERFPMKPDGYFEQSAALRKVGDWPRAEKLMEDAAIMFPTDPRVNAERRLVTERDGRDLGVG